MTKKFKVGRAPLSRYQEKREWSMAGLRLMVKAKKRGWFK